MRSNLPELSLNILPVFEMGYTGKGVRVCVLDDGLERSHDDLKDNYVGGCKIIVKKMPKLTSY